MDELNGYKIAQICGMGLVVLMLIMIAVVGLHETGTALAGVFLMFVGAGVIYGAGKLDEADRDRRLDEESRKSRDERLRRPDVDQ